MSFPEFIYVTSDEETEVSNVKDEMPKLASSIVENQASNAPNNQPKLEQCDMIKGFKGNANPDVVNRKSDRSKLAVPMGPPTKDFCPAPASTDSSAPLCRQFWKAGDYEVGQVHGPISQNGQNRLCVHPRFLHSNATSHKWVFGAIAELLDNAVDEIHNGATFVTVDKVTNPQDGNPALLVEDDGGGMDPESLRRCMSFGFSEKPSYSSIGQYGNGFKTSTMRLGADVIVFSRNMSKRTLSQSVGLLSYTFLRKTGCDDVVVPVVDYKFDLSTGAFKRLLRHGERQFSCNLSTLLKWSPFSTEVELLNQFNTIGHHGTKILIFNLWSNDEGSMELDFDSDAEDIMLSGAPKLARTNNITKMLNQKHISNQLRYSLQAYLSILYLHIPENFRILLRGKVVVPHQLVNDLRYCECIKYKPHVSGRMEAEVITTIGFLEGAPDINVHGFNIYHKNRLILPFCRVVNVCNSRGRGVAGVLEANFIKPTHDKQGFEKSTLYQKLEARLKEMTLEYWNYHCHLVGYSRRFSQLGPDQSAAAAPQMPHLRTFDNLQPVVVNHNMPAPCHPVPCPKRRGCSSAVNPLSSVGVTASLDSVGLTHPLAGCQILTSLGALPSSEKGLLGKRRDENCIAGLEPSKRQAMGGGVAAGLGDNNETQHDYGVGQRGVQEIVTMMRENEKLHEECIVYEKTEQELLVKAQRLKTKLKELEGIYQNLLAELKSMDAIKMENL